MEGGIVATDDTELAHLARSLRAHGWTRDLPDDTTIYDRRADDFFEAYRFILPGYNARPLELSGAVGVEQLKKLDGMIAMRRKNAELFRALFEGDERFIIQREVTGASSSWFSFTLILNPALDIDRRRVIMVIDDLPDQLIAAATYFGHDRVALCANRHNEWISHSIRYTHRSLERMVESKVTQWRQALVHATLDA